MNCKRILTVLVVLLVLINIGLVYLHFFYSRPHRHESDDYSWLSRSLNLTDSQSTQHVAMRKEYFKDLGVINDTIKQIKSRFIAYTAQQILNDSLVSFWTDSINRWHRRADERTYRHVSSVRSILNAKQQPTYDSLVQLMILRRHREEGSH